MGCFSRRCLSCCAGFQLAFLVALTAWLWPLLDLVYRSATTPDGWALLLQATDTQFLECHESRNRSVWDANTTYPVLDAGLRAHWKTIIAEFHALETRYGSPSVAPLFRHIDFGADVEIKRSKTAGWRTLWLKTYGFDHPMALRFFPKTMQILNALPFGLIMSAMISVMEPDVALKEHRGDFKGVLRYHVGLQMPRGENAPTPKLSIKKLLFPRGDKSVTELTWNEGDALLFDDVFLHKVHWSGAERASSGAKSADDQRRIILFVDIVRPGCAWWLHATLRAIGGIPPISNSMGLVIPRLNNLRRKAERQWAAINSSIVA